MNSHKNVPMFGVRVNVTVQKFEQGVQKCCIKYCCVLYIWAEQNCEKRRKGCGLCGREKVVKMRRSRFEIVVNLLEACLLPRGKTRIMCKVKLNFTQVNDYLSQLTSVGLLSHENGKYKTTDKGRQFISAYNHLGEIIGIPQASRTGIKVLSPLTPVNRRF
jgi:predicted transcriptional regulator